MFEVDRIFLDPDNLEVWTGEPGGKVVKRFTEDGVKFVEVVFEGSPEKTYTYLAKG